MLNFEALAHRYWRRRAAVLCLLVLTPAAVNSAATVNKAPKIWGFSQHWAAVGSTYTFQPKTFDANGDKLTFSISNKPVWIRFNSKTGLFSGQPTAASIGTSATIMISVSDGKLTTALPAFSIRVIKAVASNPPLSSVTLSWTPPTTNADGTSLTTLAGYRIWYGTARDKLDKSFKITNSGLTRYVIDNLSSGNWYFGICAYNRTGEESALSSVVKKTIP